MATKKGKSAGKSRRGISKKTRFEVFKRDSFTCKYCGAKAPEAILQIDHIEPVAKGGTNDILNLVTSCQDCNSGKSDRRLSDKSVIEQRQEQLEELQVRNEQLEMMMKWQKGLLNLEDKATEEAAKFWGQLASPYELNDRAKRELSKLIRKYGLSDVLEAMKTAADKNLLYEGGVPSAESAREAWFSACKITKMLGAYREKPHLKDLLYIRGILRNRLSYCDERQALTILEGAYDDGAEIEDLKKIARQSSSWTSWQAEMDRLAEELVAP